MSKKAAELLQAFTGTEDLKRRPLRLDLSEGAQIGHVTEIFYTAVIDGVEQEYRHQFKSKPALIINGKGTTAVLTGVKFTERGFIK